jgi:CRP-like cAMP-binding protein
MDVSSGDNIAAAPVLPRGQASPHRPFGFRDMTGAAPSSTPMVSTPMVKTKVFAGLGDTALREILGAARVRHIAPHKDVIVSGGRPEHLFLLQVGRARSYMPTESGSEILLSWKVPGDIVGLASLLPNPPAYRASATTVSECTLLVWDHGTIRRLAKIYPQLTENGFRLALHYLGKHIERHVNVLTKSAEARLAEVLHRLASEAGSVQLQVGTGWNALQTPRSNYVARS